MKQTSKNLALVDANHCVACGCCLKVCPRQALSIYKGSFAAVDPEACVGCGRCVKECPASVIALTPRTGPSGDGEKGGGTHE